VTRDAIWLDIVTERFRQARLISAGRFDRDMADPALAPCEKLTVLSEEFGEVAEIIADSLTTAAARRAGPDVVHLREELIQLAACCVGWVEQLDGVDPIRVGALAYLEPDPLEDGLPIAVFAVQPGAS
jgi:hypothetical protein